MLARRPALTWRLRSGSYLGKDATKRPRTGGHRRCRCGARTPSRGRSRGRGRGRKGAGVGREQGPGGLIYGRKSCCSSPGGGSSGGAGARPSGHCGPRRGHRGSSGLQQCGGHRQGGHSGGGGLVTGAVARRRRLKIVRAALTVVLDLARRIEGVAAEAA